MHSTADKNEIPPLEQISLQETGIGCNNGCGILNPLNHHSKLTGMEDMDGFSVLCCSGPIEVSEKNFNSGEVVGFASEDQHARSRQWNDSVEVLL
jgi:hypothetical protein